MRKLFGLGLIFVALLGGCGGNADHSITLTWTQSFANNGSCSSSVTISCINGFVEGYVTGTLPTTGPPPACSSSVTTNCGHQLNSDVAGVCNQTSAPAACTSTFNGTLPIGSLVFYVATTYIDQNGTAGTTAAAVSSPVTVAADVPAGVTAKINN